VWIHLDQQVPASQLVVEARFGGFGYTPGRTYYNYTQIKDMQSSGYTKQWDSKAQASYLAQGSQFKVTFESEEALCAKCSYAKSVGLYGLSYTDWVNDDSAHTLANAVWDELGGSTPTPERKYISASYVTEWTPWKLPDPNLIDIAFYAFAGVDASTGAVNFRCHPSWWSGYDTTADAQLKQLAALKTQHPNFKVVIALGGGDWNENDNSAMRFSAVASDPVKLANFTQSVQNFITQYNLDGVDVDWDSPMRQRKQTSQIW
jgi:GH18 family chitinase